MTKLHKFFIEPDIIISLFVKLTMNFANRLNGNDLLKMSLISDFVPSV